MPTLNLNQNLNEQQRSSITNLLNSGRTLNETDARNLAYATGQSNNWQQFLNQSASNYNIGNLAQFTTPATSNINPSDGSNSIIPNLGQSTMGYFIGNSIVSGMTSLENGIMRYAQNKEEERANLEAAAQDQRDRAFANLEGAYNQESGESLMRRLMAEQGIQEKQNQLVEFQKQLANLQNQYTVANNAIGNQPINTAIIRGQQYLKQQEFAAKATLVQSQAAIVEGQLNFAKDLVEGYYSAASTDRQNQISRYQTLLKLADDKLVKLDNDEKDNLNMMISTLQSAETRQQENKDKISALLLDPVASIAWSKTPGLSLDMNYNDIVQRLLPAYSAEQLRQFGIIHPGKSGSSGLAISGSSAGLIKGDDTGNMLKTVTYLNNLKQSGQFNDVTYRSAIYNLIGASTGLADEDYGIVSSQVNQMLGGLTPQPVINGSNNQTTPTSEFSNSFSKNRKTYKKSLQDRYNELSFLDDKKYVRDTLKNEGYNPDEVNKIAGDSGLLGFFNKIYGNF